MTRLALKDPLLDFQVLRAAGSAPYGGADLGECITTAQRVKPSVKGALTRFAFWDARVGRRVVGPSC